MRRRATQETSTTIRPRVVTAALAFLLSGTLLSAQDLGSIPSVDRPLFLPAEGRYLTLQQAQQVAAQPDALLARIAGLEVEAAVQRRHQARADYFPQIGVTFANLHFNKFLGQEIMVNRPFREGTISAPCPTLRSGPDVRRSDCSPAAHALVQGSRGGGLRPGRREHRAREGDAAGDPARRRHREKLLRAAPGTEGDGARRRAGVASAGRPEYRGSHAHRVAR